MKTKKKTGIWPYTFAVLILLAAVVFIVIKMIPEPEPDPHEGQVYINDGFGMVWMTPLEGVEPSVLTADQFHSMDGRPQYSGYDYDVEWGVDVSAFQGEIDWAKVAADGIDFAYIQVGYRGYTEGGLFEDRNFHANMQGALENGIDVGVYMFSQAITVQEAIEEANFVLQRIKDYDIALPVVFDWEIIDNGDAARTDGMDAAVLNDCAAAFCETVKLAGYEPGVYFNRHFGYYEFDLARLNDYAFWVAVPGSYPDFYYAADIWQYTFDDIVDGIETETDMNMRFIPKPQPEEETSAPQ